MIAETEKGPDIGQVVYVKDEVPSDQPEPTKSVQRKAHQGDFERRRELLKKARSALKIAERKVPEHGLEMKLVKADYTLNEHHLTIFFTAGGRVDFRELVRDLAGTLHCHIELHQVGVRDEAKMVGGLGPCGLPLCCQRFLRDFKSVGIRLAKDQDLSLNPEKISGACGRLMCCLHFEHQVYSAAGKQLPEIGEEVLTPQGAGRVTDRNLLQHEITVALDEERTVTLPAADLGNLVADDN